MNKWIIALSVVLPTLLEVIDMSVVNVSLGHIRGSLSAGLDESTWTITAYLVSNAIIIPLTGFLSRTFGRKRYLIFSVILFTISSFMCGSSRSLNSLIFFRILQGIGGGALQPISQAILFEAFPPREYGMAMAVFGVGVMVGPILGPVLGGWITDNWSWPWIFYINIPIGILSILMIMANIKDPPYLNRAKVDIDFWGLGLIAVAVGCLQVVLDKGQSLDWFSSQFIIILSLISIIAFILFILVELKVKHPVINLRQFKNISFASANLIQSFSFFVLFASIVLLPMYVQQLMGYNAYLAGLVLMPGGLVTLFIMPVMGKLVTKINPKAILIAGIIIASGSVFMMTQFNLQIDFTTAAIARMVMGVGMGMVFIPLTGMAFATIKKEEMGNATSLYNFLRNIAGSLGVAFMTTLLIRRTQFHQARLSEQISPLDPVYQLSASKITAVLSSHGQAVSPQAVHGFMYQQMIKQATLFGFTDAFYCAAVIMLLVIPLVFLLKRVKGKPEVTSIH